MQASAVCRSGGSGGEHRILKNKTYRDDRGTPRAADCRLRAVLEGSQVGGTHIVGLPLQIDASFSNRLARGEAHKSLRRGGAVFGSGSAGLGGAGGRRRESRPGFHLLKHEPFLARSRTTIADHQHGDLLDHCGVKFDIHIRAVCDIVTG